MGQRYSAKNKLFAAIIFTICTEFTTKYNTLKPKVWEKEIWDASGAKAKK